jgi:ubiquinone/menaquinone biosynthesis C-methylase UbiE
MEPATIAVLAITAAFLGFCIWIERHSRSQERASRFSKSVDDRPDAAEDSARYENGRGTHEKKAHKKSPQRASWADDAQQSRRTLNNQERCAATVPAGVGSWRQRAFAWALAHLNAKYEMFVASRKRQLLGDLSGKVLEIGPGTGANLQYFPKDRIQWIGIEPNLFMFHYLEKEAHRLGLQIELRNGTADSLPIQDSTVDAVVSTLVLCCVTDQRRSIQEILRVLKPGGKFVFIEHVAGPRGTWLRRLQNWISPIWKRAGDGCHPNRETWVELERAGFGKLTYENFKAPTPIVSPQIAGSAVKLSVRPFVFNS